MICVHPEPPEEPLSKDSLFLFLLPTYMHHTNDFRRKCSMNSDMFWWLPRV
uniref:Uncharacterized protein n=1 Tax=Anguilla anguilla TaxID=7936 RepID=A0A0E9TI24_ANGAN